MKIKYTTLEKLSVSHPVDRLDYIESHCAGKCILDIGGLDETALIKRDTKHWLHGRIASKANSVIGIDSSNLIPSEGLCTSDNAVIYKGNGVKLDESILKKASNCGLIVAGEFIEHIENPMDFLKEIRTKFPGKELILTTPNGVSFSNTLLGLIGREAQHQDHLHVFTFKTLNTLCQRSGFTNWEIIPYHFFATEMIMQSRGLKKIFVIFIEKIIRITESAFPILSMGYIVHIKI